MDCVQDGVAKDMIFMENVELLEPRQIVKAKNELFRSRTKSTNVLAARIFMAFASLVDEEDAQKGQYKKVSIPASSVLPENVVGGKRYQDISKAADVLLEQRLEQKLGKNGFTKYNLFSSISYLDGVITGVIHRDLLPFFLTAKEQVGLYTRLNFEQYVKLPSSYSQKLFAFLSSWKSNGTVEVQLDALHELLATPKTTQANFAEFRRRVLDKAHADIQAHTSLRYEWEPIKKGKKVIGIRFTFQEKPLALPTETDRTKDIAKLRKGMSKSMSSKTPEEGNTGGQCMAIARPCFQEHGGKCAEDSQSKEVCDYCRNVLQKAPHLFLRLEQTSLV